MQVDKVKINEVKTNPKNPRLIKDDKFRKLVKFIAGDDCGCKERKEKLNALFPYHKPECLTEDEYNYLSESKVLDKNTIKPSEQDAILKIYNRVFHVSREPTSCASCLREIVLKMQQVFNEYETA